VRVFPRKIFSHLYENFIPFPEECEESERVAVQYERAVMPCAPPQTKGCTNNQMTLALQILAEQCTLQASSDASFANALRLHVASSGAGFEVAESDDAFMVTHTSGEQVHYSVVDWLDQNRHFFHDGLRDVLSRSNSALVVRLAAVAPNPSTRSYVSIVVQQALHRALPPNAIDPGWWVRCIRVDGDQQGFLHQLRAARIGEILQEDVAK
jgi:hypothetical protein